MGLRSWLKRMMGQEQAVIDTWYRHWVQNGLAAIETHLATSPSTGSFCHGEAPTLADICLVPQIFNAKRYAVDPASMPTVMRIFDNCMSLAAFQQAEWSVQPDAE